MGFIIAFISMVIVFGILLPIMGAMYLDILETKQQTKQQQQQMQRLLDKQKGNDGQSTESPEKRSP